MDHVVRGVAKPYFRFPSDVFHVLTEFSEIREGTDIDGTRGALGKHTLQIDDPRRRHGAVRCYCLDEKQPVTPGVVKHDIRHLAVVGDRDAEFGKALLVHV